MIRKNVSLDEVHLQKLQPLLDKNGGNLSAAVREVIDLIIPDPESHGTFEELTGKKKYSEVREQLIQSGECVMMNQRAMKWLVKSSAGKLMDEDVVLELLNPYLLTTVSELKEFLNTSSKSMGWKIEVSCSFKEEVEPESFTMDFVGGDRDFRDFVVEAVCIFLACGLNFDVEAVHRKSNSITIYLRSFFRHGMQDKAPGVRKYFGSKDVLYREIERKPAFWVTLADLYKKFDYQRVNLDKDFFEALVAGKLPDMTKYFEIKAGRSLHEIPLSELLPLFKYLVVASQLVSDVEIYAEKGKECIKIRHEYSDEGVVLKLIQMFSNLFEAGLHKFSVSSVSKLIIFDFSLPDTSIRDAVKVSPGLDF
ncbi:MULTISPECIES: hypothetical protein [unclassified Methanosarcina]|uniref:hypothetical protein n=1 Tax=unclassified Methanosarcina TaxID=2644672 RepID=UPI000615B55B|nr:MULTISPECIES: hypothetical protein [unclassified Methanosarcina]AKB20171.1 hypothetical protein MSWHS_3308 [Methanosarcina sp. WWM596]AKB23370.1 hypothetical protein MSWH1_3099 [Methanosarcina sp. WH1]